MKDKSKNSEARDVYLKLRKTVSNTTIDKIKEKKIKISNITSDMLLFEDHIDGKTIRTFYNRVEIIEKCKMVILK